MTGTFRNQHTSLRKTINAPPGCYVGHHCLQHSGIGVHTISPTSELPLLRNPLIVDGYTQLEQVPIRILQTCDNAVYRIELDGSGAGSSAKGVVFPVSNYADTNLNKYDPCLAINRFGGAGVEIGGRSTQCKFSNFIGT